MLYVADQAWAPYGERSLIEVRERSFAVVRRLVDLGAKAVVVACNTASAAALHELRRAMPDVPFIGMEPAVKPAAEQSKGGVIGVLATSATFQGELYASVVDRHAADVEVVEQVGRGLVELVEARRLDDPAVEAVSPPTWHRSSTPGSTRSSSVAPTTRSSPAIMRRHLGAGVTVIDPAPAVARQVVRVLDEATCGRRRATVTWCTSPPATRSSCRTRWSASSATRTRIPSASKCCDARSS